MWNIFKTYLAPNFYSSSCKSSPLLAHYRHKWQFQWVCATAQPPQTIFGCDEHVHTHFAAFISETSSCQKCLTPAQMPVNLRRITIVVGVCYSLRCTGVSRRVCSHNRDWHRHTDHNPHWLETWDQRLPLLSLSPPVLTRLMARFLCPASFESFSVITLCWCAGRYML